MDCVAGPLTSRKCEPAGLLLDLGGVRRREAGSALVWAASWTWREDWEGKSERRRESREKGTGDETEQLDRSSGGKAKFKYEYASDLIPSRSVWEPRVCEQLSAGMRWISFPQLLLLSHISSYLFIHPTWPPALPLPHCSPLTAHHAPSSTHRLRDPLVTPPLSPLHPLHHPLPLGAPDPPTPRSDTHARRPPDAAAHRDVPRWSLGARHGCHGRSGCYLE